MDKRKASKEMMDRFINTIKGAGQKAGKTIREFDDQYSQKIAELYQNANPAVQAAAYTVGGAHPSFRRADVDIDTGASNRERQMAALAQYAIPAANAVPKYLIPAGGITAAGLGLLELTEQLSPSGFQQTESVLMPK